VKITENDDLGKQIWNQIESPQGYAYISDTIEEMSDFSALVEIERAVAWHKQCVKILNKIIKNSTM